MDGAISDLPLRENPPDEGDLSIELLEIQLLRDFGDKVTIARLREAYESSERKYHLELLQRGASVALAKYMIVIFFGFSTSTFYLD